MTTTFEDILNITSQVKSAADSVVRKEKQEKQLLEYGASSAGIQRMLFDAVELLRGGYKHTGWDAFELLLDYMGWKLGLNPTPRKFDNEPFIDFKTMASHWGDHLGALFCNMEIQNERLGQFPTPWAVSQLMAKMTLNTERMKPYQKVLDPCCGLGALLLAGLEDAPPGVEFYGIDIDRRMCHATMVQMEVFTRFNNKENPFYIVCGNSLLNNVDWSLANKW